MKIRMLINLLLVSLLFLAITIFISYKYQEHKRQERLRKSVSYQLIQLNKDEWGYEILKEGQLFIRQSQIPCLDGEIPFKSKEDAEKAAVLVMEKIRKGKLPSVSIEELQDLKIIE